MNAFTRTLTAVLTIALSSSVYAVPVLQVGAPAGSGDSGTYADYQKNLTNPTEKDTARTSGSKIFVAGVYQNQNVLNLGAQFGSGKDWSGVNSNFAPFDGKGAVLLVAVPNNQSGTLAIKVDGGPSLSPFLTSPILSNLFPNNHDPLKDHVADFLFFDIGDFAKNLNAVPDFETESGAADGQIKEIVFANSGFDWLHFDVLALETSEKGTTTIMTTIENNPGSHDVTAFAGQIPPLLPNPPPNPASSGSWPAVFWGCAGG